MKCRLSFFLFFICTFSLYGQMKYDYQWLFGRSLNNSSTIDFNANPMSIYPELRPMDIFISNASICNENGELLFYTNGCFIANTNHEVMENGEGLNPGTIANDRCGSTGYAAGAQSCLILPLPESSNKYYLFHTRINFADQPEVLVITDKLYYSEVNIGLNNGLGAVIEKNQVILDDTLSAGQLTAVKHANNKDWWLMSSEYRSNRYYKMLFTKNGIIDTFSQNIGNETVREGNAGGQAVFSPDGTKYVRYTPADDIYIFDFDRTTGILSGFQYIFVEEDTRVLFGGAAISSNSRFLYICTLLEVYQYDLWADDIAASVVLVAEYDGYTAPFPTNFFQAQLAPDCRIYINSNNGVDVLHVINHPNRKGIACDVQQHSVKLASYHGASMPNFPNYRLGSGFEVCDSSILTNLPATISIGPPEIILFPNPVQSNLRIQLTDYFLNTDELEIQLYDLTGKLMIRELVSSISFDLDVSALENGTYFCVLEEGGKRLVSKRFVVMK